MATAAGTGKPRFAFVMPFHIAEGRGGGAEVQAWLLAKELARRGFETSYIAQSVKGKAGRTEVSCGVTLSWVPYAHHFRWANAAAYYRALSALDPQIVVQRGASFMTGVNALWCRRHGARLAWICSDNAMPHRWMHWRLQRRANAREKVALPKAAVFLGNALINDLSRHWGMRHVTWAFTQNDLQSTGLRREFGRTSFRMMTGHEVPDRIRPAEQRRKDGMVLWVANLGPRKRPEVFVELARQCADRKLKFVMVGGRDDPDYLHRLLADAPANLQWLGRLPFEETLSWFDRAAVFVNTSTQEGEGFPNTFIQAWLRGVPVLSLGVDPDDILAAHRLGAVEPKIEDLVVRLQVLLQSPDMYQAVSESAREYALPRHSIGTATTLFLTSLR